ncbi:MAG: hypothetical protein PHN44_04350 [Candidatus Marinimicrobia bacterium]|nr:hypothetical protein [Candidatus Neomarinimicrobiota bacterium]
MSWEYVGTGGVVDIGRLDKYESSIPEGSKFQVRLALRTSVSQSVVTEIKRQMVARGVTDADATAAGTTMTITARKGFPWLAVIAAIILAVIVLVAIIVSWSIFKEIIPTGAQGALTAVIIIALAVLALGIGGEKIKRSLK